jgi:hypothetical protein
MRLSSLFSIMLAPHPTLESIPHRALKLISALWVETPVADHHKLPPPL